ncbi:MAG: hypothetical protein KXJ49_08495 [Vulcanococcus sp.]|uniref:hypothetical protein n=1 Tax=Vulcanococcus sp. TaxID=2856995 RepID=UPI0025F6C098|nr:hypothetical protein [Vulcanococcus sp.]MBW0167524.1 hypothetical protein [Vulcanococcus sp.]
MTSSVVGDTFFGLDLKKLKQSLLGFRRSVSKRILLIDFDATSVTLAEAQVQEGAVSFAHVRRLSLPEEALERGVPAEPRKMAGLIKGFCEECDIPAHRAAVVIPNDAVFTSVLSLPSSMTAEAALDYVLDPGSAAQVPVQLDQMDADLIPLDIPGKLSNTQSYFLIAIPRKLVDRVVEMLQLAQMDLLQLQVALSSQLQHCAPYLQELERFSSLLHLDLQRDCTLASLLIASGPVRLTRLTSIRDFPDPPDTEVNPADGPVLNAEAQIIGSDSYLPLSDLDLKRLVQEIKQFLNDCLDQYPDLEVASVVVSGVNTAHPSIDSLLRDQLQLPVEVSRPLATQGVGQFMPDAPLVLQGLGRLIGLGLSFLPSSALASNRALEVQPLAMESMIIPEPEPEPEPEIVYKTEAVVQDSHDHDQLYLPKPSQELLLAASKPFEQVDELPPEQQLILSETEARDLELDAESNQQQQPRIFDDSQQSEPTDISSESPEIVVGDDASLPAQAIFSFSSDDEVTSFGPESPEVLEPLVLDAAIHLEEDQDEVPFSMADLLSSFETKATVEEEAQALELEPSMNEHSEVSEAIYMVDDPSLWPSISKLQEISDEPEPQDADDSDRSIS